MKFMKIRAFSTFPSYCVRSPWSVEFPQGAKWNIIDERGGGAFSIESIM